MMKRRIMALKPESSFVDIGGITDISGRGWIQMGRSKTGAGGNVPWHGRNWDQTNQLISNVYPHQMGRFNALYLTFRTI